MLVTTETHKTRLVCQADAPGTRTRHRSVTEGHGAVGAVGRGKGRHGAAGGRAGDGSHADVGRQAAEREGGSHADHGAHRRDTRKQS